ncbi:MAG: sigma-54 dependent transcriptional regulator, partial [Verrucomicrobiota bacterium]
MVKLKKRRPRILIADDDSNLRRLLSRHIEKNGYEPVPAEDGADALASMDETISVALLDLEMPHASGLEVLASIRQEFPQIVPIMLSATGQIDDAVKAMKQGAIDYLTKPFHMEELLQAISRAVKMAALTKENSQLSQENKELRQALGGSPSGGKFIGESKATTKLLVQVEKVSSLDSTIMITGESGVGKSFLARLIHQASARQEHPFVCVSCPALPRELLESEMFGHEKGAFTGAHQKRIGKVELAAGGTLFLDEVGDLPLDLQPKLLNLLQDREFQRVGGNETIQSNIRVIAATNVDLVDLVRRKEFREDLYYRLNVIPINVPSLTERREDIPSLVNHILRRIARQRGLDQLSMEENALAMACEMPWPGNVRQLENTLERASAFCSNHLIKFEDFPPEAANSRGRYRDR